jgi:aspartyl protease family protein
MSKSNPIIGKSKTTIPMFKKNSVYTIPVKINGLEMDFIFDTGASDIAISQTEADILMRKVTSPQDDILGEGHYRIANGDLITAQFINLRTVQLGNKITLNVRASVTPKIDAPLLLGQSALEKFGKVSMDYNRGIITLE